MVDHVLGIIIMPQQSRVLIPLLTNDEKWVMYGIRRENIIDRLLFLSHWHKTQFLKVNSVCLVD